MRKKVLGLVMAALTISTFGAFAQTEVQVESINLEQVSKDACKDKKDKKGKKDCKKGDRKGEKKKGKKGSFNAFRGIELTAEQQQQINQLKNERKAKVEAEKKASKEAKELAKKEFTASVEKILTPDQFKQYQANCDSLKLKKEARKANKMAGKDRKKAKGKPIAKAKNN